MQIFNWLESRSRSKAAQKMTNSQNPRNGDPNKIYSVYFCADPMDDEHNPNQPPSCLYSIKMIRPGEPQPIIMTKTNERIKTSFKKYNIQKVDLFDRMDLYDELHERSVKPVIPESQIIHSSDLRQVHFKFFEGIYPIDQELGVQAESDDTDDRDQYDMELPDDVMRDMSGEEMRNESGDAPDDAPDNRGTDNSSDTSIDVAGTNILDILDRPHIQRIVHKLEYANLEPLENIPKTDREHRNDDFMGFVRAMHTLDSKANRSSASAEYDVIFSNSSDKWLDHFCDKLEKVELYLRYIAKGGRGQFHLRYHRGQKSYIKSESQYEVKRKGYIEDIHAILGANTDLTRETAEDFRRVSNLVTDPPLFDGSTYQVRYDETLLTWHANYSEIIRELRIVPSRRFCVFIIAFDLSDFFGQNQSLDILAELHGRLSTLYFVPERPKVRFTRKASTVTKITRKF